MDVKLLREAIQRELKIEVEQSVEEVMINMSRGDHQLRMGLTHRALRDLEPLSRHANDQRELSRAVLLLDDAR